MSSIVNFKIGDLLLSQTFQNIQDPNTRKLAMTWEGPYQMIDITRLGSCKLQDMHRKILRSWNAIHLKRYYHWT